jgi:hypothetical protein
VLLYAVRGGGYDVAIFVPRNLHLVERPLTHHLVVNNVGLHEEVSAALDEPVTL